MDLAGKVGIVTGATSGIGWASAEAMAAAGMKLVLSGRRAELLEDRAARLPEAVALPGEITRPGTPETLFRTALERFGAVDVVFNNAGMVHYGPIEEIDVEQLCAMARTNVEAAYRVAYLAMKQFRAAGSGHLINTSSVLGAKTRKYAGGYAGTKHAIEALSEALRLEVAGSRIKVTSIAPGLVRTDAHRDFQVRPEVAQGIARPLVPEDVAAMVMFALTRPAHVSVPRLTVLPQDQEV